MPQTKATSSLSGMMESVEEQSDLDMMSAVDSEQENQEPVKKGKGKGRVGRKTKPVSKRLSGGKAKPMAKSTAKSRGKKAPLNEQGTAQPSDTEEVENFEEVVEDTVVKPKATAVSTSSTHPATKEKPKRKGRPPGKSKQPKVEPVQSETKTMEKDGEFEYTPRREKEVSNAKNQIVEIKEGSPEQMIPETQPVPMDLDDSQIEEDEIAEPQSVYRQANHARPHSRQAQPILTTSRRRGGSASDTERTTDPALRRKLGEMTKKFESLDLKYRNLREIGIKEAETNFEKLRKQSEEQTRVANDLIASLRKELSIQKAQTNEARTQRTTLASTQTSLKVAESQIAELASSLTSVQNENKTLQAKLTASRSAATTTDSVSNYSKPPGSAIKGKAPALRMGGPNGATDAGTAAQIAQLKVDLYSDLTGLILRGVDRQDETDTYDCIQTGRNGTLHFKLIVPTDTNVSYEENEIQYLPRLDGNRDRALLEILPDYLREEITFSSANATKFYSRVVDTLTRVV